MKNIGKTIIFFIMIGILVSSLSLFALAGCSKLQISSSSRAHGNTTIDNGADQTGNKGSEYSQSTDTPNGNADAHSTIGGGETSTTQPDNGNGGDTDLQNDPEEGNIGGTGNPENGTQSGTDNPNGNSGDSTEENGENGNTSSGNENGDDNGNSGDNGNETPNQDDPTSDDPQPEELDFSGLEAKLVEVIREKHWGITSENIIVYG